MRNILGQGNKNDSNKILWALRDVSFELTAGVCIGLIGQNGAGKSTLLKLLANITRPTSGQIESHGRLSALIELGSGFHPDLTGRENIYLYGTVLGLSRQEVAQRFNEIVAFSEIERFIETPVKRYSSGMLVRLGFSVAACIEPDILLIDEVLAVGDALFRQKCLKRIDTLIRNGTTIIFVSHNLHMVEAVCPLSIYIKHGQVQFLGDTSEAIKFYERDLHEQQATQVDDSSRHEKVRIDADVQITNLDIVNAYEHNGDEFHSDKSVEIRISYQSRKSIEDINVVIHIVRSDGLTCCRLRTRIDDVPISVKEGEGIFSVILEPLQLTSGTYYAIASIRTESELVELARLQSESFYVTGEQLSDSELSGVFEPKRRWVSSIDSSNAHDAKVERN